jgi:hypothetical protein
LSRHHRQPERSIDDPPELRFESPVMDEREEREFDRWREIKDEKMSDEDQIKNLLGVLKARASAAEAEVERLRTALMRYAARGNWGPSGHLDIDASGQVVDNKFIPVGTIEHGFAIACRALAHSAAPKEQHHDAGRDS